MIKIVTIVGARPQFIKAAAVSRAIRNEFAQQVSEVLVHTGQHYDANMSEVFFEELDIPHPKYNLEISGGQHGAMTGRMLFQLMRSRQEYCPCWALKPAGCCHYAAHEAAGWPGRIDMGLSQRNKKGSGQLPAPLYLR